jgi:hypothetical protein
VIGEDLANLAQCGANVGSAGRGCGHVSLPSVVFTSGSRGYIHSMLFTTRFASVVESGFLGNV